jgi:hypothetical protein
MVIAMLNPRWWRGSLRHEPRAVSEFVARARARHPERPESPRRAPDPSDVFRRSTPAIAPAFCLP